MPSYLLFTILYFIVICIWLQHCIYGGCIFSTIESKLIGDKYSIWDPILDIFHINLHKDSFNEIHYTCLYLLSKICKLQQKLVLF